MLPLWISKDLCITKEKGKLIKWKGGGLGVYTPGLWRFEGYKCRERRRPEESCNYRKYGDKRIHEWSGPALFQFNCKRMLGIGKMRATRKTRLGGIADFNSSKRGNTSSEEVVTVEPSISLTARIWNAGWLSTDASHIWDRGGFGPCREIQWLEKSPGPE